MTWVSPTTQKYVQPRVLLSRFVGPGSSFGPAPLVPTQRIFLLWGMDAYGTVQPNNGNLTFQNSTTGFVMWEIQQSENFPGPFYWRGQIPLFPADNFFVSATVGFNINFWGAYVPTYITDQDLGN